MYTINEIIQKANKYVKYKHGTLQKQGRMIKPNFCTAPFIIVFLYHLFYPQKKEGMQNKTYLFQGCYYY